MTNPNLLLQARSLRRSLTTSERRLWHALRRNALGVPFRRQHPIPPYIADFAASSVWLIVEVDGSQHADGADAVRDAALLAAGWRVLRFWNNEVMANLEAVLVRVTEAIEEQRLGDPLPSPPPLCGRGSGGADD